MFYIGMALTQELIFKLNLDCKMIIFDMGLAWAPGIVF